MEHIFIELWKFKDSWTDADLDTRSRYVNDLMPSVQAIMDAGVEIIAWGYNDLDVDHRAPYDAFGVYRMPDRARFDDFQRAVSASGWYHYFEHVNAGGVPIAPGDLLGQHIQLMRPATITA